jgi:REP element-mobilizing transposase RayT
MEFVEFNPWEPVRITQGNLPHWQQDRRTYFITWRTGDSIPVVVLKEWHRNRDIWLRSHGVRLPQLRTLSPEVQHEYHERFTLPWHEHLDLGHGRCWLRDDAVRRLVEQTLLHFDRARYDLGDFVLMPNHVHLLVTPFAEIDLEQLCSSWKRYSSGEINKLLRRRGEFWQTESYDHIVRSGEALNAIQNYIANNPVKAKLRAGEYTLYQPLSWHAGK